jgi:hypothetical protein
MVVCSVGEERLWRWCVRGKGRVEEGRDGACGEKGGKEGCGKDGVGTKKKKAIYLRQPIFLTLNLIP